jgi:hypothetical protein
MRAVPVGLLNDQLRMVVKFRTNPLDWGVSAVPAQMTALRVSDVKYQAQLIKLNYATEKLLLESHMGKLMSPCMDYQYYSTTVAANSSKMSYQIPHRSRSVTAIFVCFRASSTLGDGTVQSLVNRFKPVNSYSFRVGSSRVPQTDVDCTGDGVEAYMELQRAFGLVNMAETPTALPLSVYNSAGFVIGLALSSFNQETEVLADGINADAINLVFEASINNTVAMQVDFFVASERVLVAEAGQLRYME